MNMRDTHNSVYKIHQHDSYLKYAKFGSKVRFNSGENDDDSSQINTGEYWPGCSGPRPVSKQFSSRGTELGSSIPLLLA